MGKPWRSLESTGFHLEHVASHDSIWTSKRAIWEPPVQHFQLPALHLDGPKHKIVNTKYGTMVDNINGRGVKNVRQVHRLLGQLVGAIGAPTLYISINLGHSNSGTRKYVRVRLFGLTWWSL